MKLLGELQKRTKKIAVIALTTKVLYQKIIHGYYTRLGLVMTKAYDDTIENLKVEQTSSARRSFIYMRIALAGDKMTSLELQKLKDQAKLIQKQEEQHVGR